MAEPEIDVRERLVDILLEKVADERFPSTTTLDLIESLLRPDEVPVYAQVLLRQVRSEPYPSLAMLRRIAALTN
ncbi:hypothetical protein FB561_2815 [Kribbella amoyensis]|uniref:DUF2795 domain-containing protein n=1 Tax=Kribbella amoyensis TaxID=996641 RepID=A0A561BS26_9ACTN|nr:hypothetical protein [Kribbella amoyensis]TWD81694.1 hypothetical protein FB561_2815 [Kribbella amoyensis]